MKKIINKTVKSNKRRNEGYVSFICATKMRGIQIKNIQFKGCFSAGFVYFIENTSQFKALMVKYRQIMNRGEEHMKKWKVWIVAATACAMLLAGCGSKNAENVKEADSEKQTEQETEKEPIKIASLKGPTSIGMVKLMDDAEANGKYDVTVYASATEVSPLLISGDVDVANIPANLAAVLYAKTNGNIEVLNINTLGVLYMVGTNRESATFEELKGATIYTTGKGTTPEYTLNYLLEQNGMLPDDFHIEYKSEATEVVAALQSDTNAVGILPQPFQITVFIYDFEFRSTF